MRKKKLPSRPKRIREIARERVGGVKPSRVIEPKKDPKKDRKPKHKRSPGPFPEDENGS
jgi:hypothetical protein